MSNYPTISVCMIVKNEEANLPRVLESVKGLADEVIVVDTGSTDRTVEIASSYGAKTCSFEWCDDFSAARNESLRHATKDYILWLDGDDEISKEDHVVIKKHLKRNKGSGVYLKLISVSEDGAPMEALQLRMFPNHMELVFKGRVHEQIIYSLQDRGIPLTGCGARITHFGYHAIGSLIEKLKRNKAIHEQELREDPDNVTSLFFLARAHKAFNEHKEALECLEKVLKLGNPSRDRDILMVAVVDMANVLYNTGRENDALSVLEQWRTPLGNPTFLNFTLGELYFKGKDYDNVYRFLAPLKDEKFDHEIVPLPATQTRLCLLKYLGVSALFLDDPSAAETYFAESLKIDGENDEAYHHLSLAKERGADMEGAIEICRKGIERLGDGSPFLRKRLFMLLIKSGNLDEALLEYEDLNGFREKDLEVLCGMFLISSRRLSMEGIQRYYSLIQSGLSLPYQEFPEGLPEMRRVFPVVGEAKAQELFETAISHLLKINS